MTLMAENDAGVTTLGLFQRFFTRGFAQNSTCRRIVFPAAANRGGVYFVERTDKANPATKTFGTSGAKGRTLRHGTNTPNPWGCIGNGLFQGR